MIGWATDKTSDNRGCYFMLRNFSLVAFLSVFTTTAAAQSTSGLCDRPAMEFYSPAEITKLLNEPQGAFIRCYDGYTPLHVAVSAGNLKAIELIAANGADLDATNEFRSTPLHVAVMASREDVVELLVRLGANIHAAGSDGQTPLEMARDWGENDVAEALIAVGARQ